MTHDSYQRLRRYIQGATGEGWRTTVYDDATGKPIGPGSVVVGHPTIGWGRALDTNGITEAEGDCLLQRDMTETVAGLALSYAWYAGLDPVRQVAVAEIAFTTGVDGVARLRTFTQAMSSNAFAYAASRLLTMKWARDVKERRANRIAMMIRTGRWPEAV